MAREAPSEALSSGKEPDDQLACRRPSTYASSMENIARLLKGWVGRGSTNLCSSSSSVSTTSSQASASASNCAVSSSSPEPQIDLGESAAAEEAQLVAPFLLLESWLLDESAGAEEESFVLGSVSV